MAQDRKQGVRYPHLHFCNHLRELSTGKIVRAQNLPRALKLSTLSKERSRAAPESESGRSTACELIRNRSLLVISTHEALSLLSKHARNPELQPEQLVKILTMYGELAGWDQAAQTTDEQDLNALVVDQSAIED
jgi:hypothetical protein